MIAIKLVDARRGLNIKCRELFKDEKIAESIYRYLCDGIEECDDVEPERKPGEWIDPAAENCYRCSVCDEYTTMEIPRLLYHYCPNCGAKMDGERKDNDEDR